MPKMQADGGGTNKGKPDGVNDTDAGGRTGGGQSGGGAFADDVETAKNPTRDSHFGTAGQTVQGYTGKGQIAGEPADGKDKGRTGQGG